jgi:uncharacterized protein YciI
MKLPAFLLLFFSVIHLVSIAQNSDTAYDAVLAKKLNADDYGMKKYVLVILKTGSANITDKTQLDSIFKGHMQNISRLAAENKLVIAGPLGKNDKSYEGIFVLNAATVEEAKELLDTDPAVHAKALEPELYSWYGSAALQATLDIHKKIQKKHF